MTRDDYYYSSETGSSIPVTASIVPDAAVDNGGRIGSGGGGDGRFYLSK